MVNILVVDDIKTVREIIKKYLSEICNCSVYSADGCKAAKKILKEEAIDMVLTDLHMPEQDGNHLIEYIKNDNKTKDIPTVLVTSSTDSDMLNKSKKLGVNDIIFKPFDKEDLHKTLKTYVPDLL